MALSCEHTPHYCLTLSYQDKTPKKNYPRKRATIDKDLERNKQLIDVAEKAKELVEAASLLTLRGTLKEEWQLARQKELAALQEAQLSEDDVESESADEIEAEAETAAEAEAETAAETEPAAEIEPEAETAAEAEAEPAAVKPSTSGQETPAAAADGAAVGAKGSTGAPPGGDPGDVSVGPTTPTSTQKRKADDAHPDITLDGFKASTNCGDYTWDSSQRKNKGAYVRTGRIGSQFAKDQILLFKADEAQTNKWRNTVAYRGGEDTREVWFLTRGDPKGSIISTKPHYVYVGAGPPWNKTTSKSHFKVVRCFVVMDPFLTAGVRYSQ